MGESRARLLILIGFLLVLAGAVLPFLMVLHIIPSTFFLNFFSYSASVAGLFLGMIGGVWYARAARRGDDDQGE